MNFKSVIRLIRINLIILLILFLTNYFFFEVYNPTVIILTLAQVFILFDGPAIYLLLNYYKYNKNIEFSINPTLRKITITENGIPKSYDYKDVESSIYNIGKYWKNALDRKMRLPTLFSEFGYWDLTFKNGDRYYLTTLLHDFLLEQEIIKGTTYRFRLIPYVDKSKEKKGIELKPIKYRPKSRIEKLTESYNKKTKEELEYIIENKSLYQEEAVMLAEQILRKKTTGNEE